MNRLLSGALAGALGVSAVLLPASAHAERWSSPDPSGNVEGWQYDPEPEPCGTMTDVDGSIDANDDITRLSVRHDAKQVRVVVGFRDLDRSLEQEVAIHLAVPEARGRILDISRFRGPSGRFMVLRMFHREWREPSPEEVDDCGDSWEVVSGGPCRTTATFDFVRDRVRATVPRRCLREPEWVRVGVRSYGWAPYDAETGTFGGFHDEWGVPEEGASRWLPPFGPELRAS